MTEHVVLTKAIAYRDDLMRRKSDCVRALSAVDVEISHLEIFFEVWASLTKESTAARMDGPEQPIAKRGLTGASVNGDAQEREGETTPPAGTQAPPVEDLHAQAAVEGTDPETVNPAPNYSDPMPAPPVAEQMSQIPAAVEGAPKTESLWKRVAGVFAEHPDWPARRIGQHLGANQKAVRTAARGQGIILAKVSDDERDITQQEVAEKARQRAAGRRPERLKARVISVFNEHPDWHATQIALHLGVDRGSVRVTARDAGITLRKMTSAERSELQSSLNAHRRTPVLAHKARIAELHALHPDWQLADYAAEMKLSRVRISVLAHEAGIVIARPKAPPAPKPGSVRQETRAERVTAVLARHPDWTAPEVAQFLGLEAKIVRAVAKANGIEIKPVSDIGRQLAARAVDAAPRQTQAAEAKRQPVTGLSPKPRVEEPLAFAGEQDEADADYVAPPLSSPTWQSGPNSKWFRLRRADGQWLHMSGRGFTADKNMGWIGRIGQLRTARARFDDAKGLQIVGVSAVAK